MDSQMSLRGELGYLPRRWEPEEGHHHHDEVLRVPLRRGVELRDA